MRYQVFNSRDADAKAVFSAPWYWLAHLLAGLVSHKWRCCRLVDSVTRETLMEWLRAERPCEWLGANSTTASVKIGPDGRTHTFFMGSTKYGMGQAPEEGHQPLTIIDGQCSVIPRDSREDGSGLLPK